MLTEVNLIINQIVFFFHPLAGNKSTTQKDKTNATKQSLRKVLKLLNRDIIFFRNGLCFFINFSA